MSAPATSHQETTATITSRLLYSVEEAAAQLSLSRAEVFRLIARGELYSVKYHRRRLIPVAELTAWAARLTNGGRHVTSQSQGGPVQS